MADDIPSTAETPSTTETPWRRDPEELARGLSAWVARTVGPEATVAEVAAPEGNGMSSETVLFTVARGDTLDGYAARLPPLPSLYPVFPAYDLDLQRRCMRLVGDLTAVPVPEVPWYEADPSWLGTPFLVMTRVDGVVPSDNPPYVFGGWLLDASPAERARLQRNAVDVLAKLHELTPQRCDLSFLARPDHGTSPLDQQLGYQRWYYEWARDGVAYPLIERTFAWLADNRPAEGRAVLNWGDGRIGNMLFDGFEPVAVLDWEMAAVGPAEVDLAWMIFLHRFFQDLAERFGLPGIPGFMERDAMVATYEELSSTAVCDLAWFEVFAALRFAVVSVRTSTRGIAYGLMEPVDDPDDLVMFRDLVERMLDGSYWR